MRILLLPWLFWVPLFTVLLGISPVFISGQCLTDQRSLLLQLKNTLKFDSSTSVRLVSWNQTNDCCVWKGVTCDQAGAGRVTGLELNGESISGGIDDSSSLFSLQFLETLNLANNNFNSTPIPSSFGNLTSLKVLNLSNAGFGGQIPIELSFMTSLVNLDLSTLFPGPLPLRLENPNLLTLLQNLIQLTELHLDGVKISAPGRDWCNAISSSLPNLKVLSLSNCYLSGPIDPSLQKLQSLSVIHLGSNNLSAQVPAFFAGFSNLTDLILSSCNLFGTFPEMIFQVPKLQTLNLANNKLLNGVFPKFPANVLLRNLMLSDTNFSGGLPDSIGKLKNLSRLDLSRTNLTGPIPGSMANLTQLSYLDLSSNNFTGSIPSFQMSKNLKYIDLSHNFLTGPIPPTHFEGLKDLENVDLGYNSFNGSVPLSLFSLPSLQKIQLSNNLFDGEVGLVRNKSLLSPLDTLDLSGNKLEGPVPEYFFDLQRLSVLSLSFNNFRGVIELDRIKRLQNLTRLELSYNHLTIVTSDADHNLSSFPQLTILKLASCKLQKFPALMNQSRLNNLDLSVNQIPGQIPNWIWNVGRGTLSYLNLSYNLLEGLQRPYTISSLDFLSVLDLHSNKLRGEIPVPPETAIYVDYSSNNFSLPIPAEIGNKVMFAIFFSVSNNSITGAIPPSLCHASYLQVLDLSNNKFTGNIPQCLIDNLAATLGVLNLRNNNLSGKILGMFPESCALKTLDCSGNNLDGQVPRSLANCAMLEVLNLGNNKIDDTFPCFLKNSSSLRVIVLRSNKFQGGLGCRGHHNNSWPKLQIIDLALNNFSGPLPKKCFLRWKAMMIDVNNSESDMSHLHYAILKFNNVYYQDTVTVTSKGSEMELMKILTLFTSIDFSCNNLQGEIPDTVGALNSLYLLNLSHNALKGHIPSALGNLKELESLDLSVNNLSGSIPAQLTRLTFLSVLNLSYNRLAGMIPTGSQFHTFLETSYEGNDGLCGKPLNRSCGNPSTVPPTAPRSKKSDSALSTEFDWQFIYTGLGFGVGAGFVVGPLMFWRQGSNWCDRYAEKFARTILPALAFIFTCFNDAKVDSAGDIEEEPLDDTGESDEDGYENEVFPGRYCVFCSKLDIYRKKAIHNPRCGCHESPPFSSISSSSFSSSP